MHRSKRPKYAVGDILKQEIPGIGYNHYMVLSEELTNTFDPATFEPEKKLTYRLQNIVEGGNRLLLVFHVDNSDLWKKIG